MALTSVQILGGGPAGLYAAILLKRAMPHLHLRLTEQNPPGATFGFGVVFSDQALDFLQAGDPETHALITPRMERWRNMTLALPDGRVEIDGVGFSAIGRAEFNQILRARAESLGVEMRFGVAVERLADLKADLVIGADGLNSLVRRTHQAEFAPRLDHFTNRFAWFGTDRPFDTLTQSFIRSDKGALNAHHYRYAPDRSTFIVECDAASFAAHGFDTLTEDQSARLCETLFADVLQGARLITNKSHWRQFPRLWCDRWVAGRHVILGDAAHTAHFSIGSGTRLAMEDALALVRALQADDDVDAALAAFQRDRPPVAKKIVDAANTSARWYEGFAAKMALPPVDFAFDYITRSGRVDIERLRALSPGFMARWQAERRPADPVGDTDSARAIGFAKADHPNCSAILWDNLARNPGALAVTGPAGHRTYAQLIAEAARWGNFLTAAGLQRGERVPMFLDDTPAYPAAFFGAVRAGFVPVLLNTQTNADTLRYFLTDSGARLVLCEAALAHHFPPEVLETRRLVPVNGPEDPTAGHPETLPCAETGPDDMAFWMYSSGSTGRPKGIVHLHHDMAFTQAAYGRHILRLTQRDVCFSVPKAFFAYGFGNAFTFPFSVGACTVLMPGQPRPEAVLDVIETFRPTVFFGLPTLYTALARAPGVQGRDLSSIRLSLSAAEVLSDDIAAAWRRLVGHAPTEGLGSTEMLHIYLSNRPDDQRPGAAGAPVPGYDVRLVAPDGTPAAPGAEGVMQVRGPSSAPFYWNRPDKTADTMRGDWIHTGDRFVERDGYFHFLGRADDLVKVSGQWVWPLEVERCLAEHPQVHECAVLAVDLPDRRTILRAVVVARPGPAPEPQSLRDWIKTRLQPYKAPREVVFVDSLPKTGTGKIDRQALKTP